MDAVEAQVEERHATPGGADPRLREAVLLLDEERARRVGVGQEVRRLERPQVRAVLSPAPADVVAVYGLADERLLEGNEELDRTSSQE